jgi:hypothetical protein
MLQSNPLPNFAGASVIVLLRQAEFGGATVQ